MGEKLTRGHITCGQRENIHAKCTVYMFTGNCLTLFSKLEIRFNGNGTRLSPAGSKKHACIQNV